MPGTATTRTSGFYSDWGPKLAGPGTRAQRWAGLAGSSIFVLGYPRSGTTWLAKIFDSHPDILYRHEPDEALLPTPGLDPRMQVTQWLMQRGLHVAAKRPMFRKSWRPGALHSTRKALAALIALSLRVPSLAGVIERIYVPDLIAPNRWGSVRAMIKLVNWDGSLAARMMPDVRLVFILRHPAGQVASVMAGLAANRFGPASDESGTPLDLTAAVALAQREGIGGGDFDALPDAAKFAWAWRAFNEPATEALRDLANARIVIYEELCSRPEAVARDLFSFTGLAWHPQSTAFLDTSTQHDRPNGYFDVYRSTAQVADRWRQTMSLSDQDAVRTVLSTSPLARCWPDLAPFVA